MSMAAPNDPPPLPWAQQLNWQLSPQGGALFLLIPFAPGYRSTTSTTPTPKSRTGPPVDGLRSMHRLRDEYASLPSIAHPEGRDALLTSTPFPWENCYLAPFTSLVVRSFATQTSETIVHEPPLSVCGGRSGGGGTPRMRCSDPGARSDWEAESVAEITPKSRPSRQPRVRYLGSRCPPRRSGGALYFLSAPFADDDSDEGVGPGQYENTPMVSFSHVIYMVKTLLPPEDFFVELRKLRSIAGGVHYRQMLVAARQREEDPRVHMRSNCPHFEWALHHMDCAFTIALRGTGTTSRRSRIGGSRGSRIGTHGIPGVTRRIPGVAPALMSMFSLLFFGHNTDMHPELSYNALQLLITFCCIAPASHALLGIDILLMDVLD
ncbi:hypothetical protein GGX14DRAFT_384241 [Mycena pura]|uniref:Uncharacterized protein n=1 Tax=Mycena pura TaxID=153505 RepID=A0AAD6YUY8_9AGAR|nr:hypothetical protein GGX14DRAFT_384241 [Mycena pura]